MIHDNITASRYFRNKNLNKEASFFIERDSETGANLIIEFVDGFNEKEFKVTHLSLEALQQLVVMFKAAINEKYLEGNKYIETEENMVSLLLTKIEK